MARTRKNVDKPATTYSTKEIVRLVKLMVHDLGHRVFFVRAIAYSLRDEPEFRSDRLRKEIEDLVRAVDDLEYGFDKMRHIDWDEIAICNFVEDVLQPAMFFSTSRRHPIRLLVDPSVRKAPRVRLRRWPAFLAVIRLIANYEPESLRCKFSFSGSSAVCSLELLGQLGIPDPLPGDLFREAGVFSFRFDSFEAGVRHVVTLEMGVDSDPVH